MATLLLALLALLAFALRWRRFPRAARVFRFTAAGWFVLVGTGWFPAFILDRLESVPRLFAPSWAARNAIVVLGSGNASWPGSTRPGVSLFGIARVTEAVRLFHACDSPDRRCRIVVTGGDPTRAGVNEADLMADLAAGLGVPASSVVREPRSNNTFQNAQFTAELLSVDEHVILVSSAAHLPRALAYFEHFGVHAEGAPSDVVGASSLYQPALNFAVMDLAMHELAGIARLHLYNALGINPPPARR